MNKYENRFTIRTRLKSFIYAFSGLKIMVREEHNSRIHIAASIIVILFSIIFNLSLIEWIIIIFSIALVISVETINSAIENMADFICPGLNDQIKKIKDLSAAAVLISAICAVVIGLLIFIPKIIS